MALDEAKVGGVLPDRQARARRSPRLHRLGVGALARADPLEQVQDQVLDGGRSIYIDVISPPGSIWISSFATLIENQAQTFNYD